MSERIAINAGPLIALGRMQAFDVIEQLPYEFRCPPQVENGLLTGEVVNSKGRLRGLCKSLK